MTSFFEATPQKTMRSNLRIGWNHIEDYAPSTFENIPKSDFVRYWNDIQESVEKNLWDAKETYVKTRWNHISEKEIIFHIMLISGYFKATQQNVSRPHPTMYHDDVKMLRDEKFLPARRNDTLIHHVVRWQSTGLNMTIFNWWRRQFECFSVIRISCRRWSVGL